MMVDQNPLAEFVRKAKAQGVADEFIVALLKNTGWSERRIFATFIEYYEATLGAPVPSRGGPIEYARDAFFYLLTFIALGWWTIALGQIFFTLIDRSIPDPLQPVIYAQYSLRDVSWQIAGVLVAYPLFVYVTRTLTREAATRPELFDSDVRKWLTNLALVFAAVIVTGDLVAFLARLLSGDLTSRFLLQVLVVFVLAGGVFGYYLGSLRERFTLRWRRGFFAASLVAVVLGLASGFFANGTPAAQRATAADERRVGDLRRISQMLRSRREGKKGKPAGVPLNQDALAQEGFSYIQLHDPITQEPYEYRRLGDSKYELCARFDTSTDEDKLVSETWKHPKGRRCFKLDAAENAPEYP